MGAVFLIQRAATTLPDIGWVLLEDYHGKGYATEAATELLRFAREDIATKEFIAAPGPTNRQSYRVAQKLGFVEGRKVKDKGGHESLVFILSGMKFDKNMSLSIMGEGNQ
ncbi:hypothetical protein MMC25_002440 [Agyrium rufum]|nr:hypothetical protein [Agyrium rufum]